MQLLLQKSFKTVDIWQEHYRCLTRALSKSDKAAVNV